MILAQDMEMLSLYGVKGLFGGGIPLDLLYGKRKLFE
jgi:hypothetical protein